KVVNVRVTPMSYQFFLSYSRDDRDEFLQRFYTNLEKEVRILIPEQDSSAGFMDTESIQLGEEWSEKLLRALQTCKVFIALGSPHYSTRPWGGKARFLRRDSVSSIAYSEELISDTISTTLQSTDRHYGIVGQEPDYFQLDS